MSFHFTYTLQLLDILFDLHLEVDLLVSETPKQPIKLSCEHQVLNLTTSYSELYVKKILHFTSFNINNQFVSIRTLTGIKMQSQISG